MTEVVLYNKVEEIIAKWTQGVEFDNQGYEDLAFTLQLSALDEAVKLSPAERQEIADRLFPIK